MVHIETLDTNDNGLARTVQSRLFLVETPGTATLWYRSAPAFGPGWLVEFGHPSSEALRPLSPRHRLRLPAIFALMMMPPATARSMPKSQT